MSQSEHRFNFESFPAKTEAGREKLLTTARSLAGHKSDFFSYVYGTDGSTRDRTLNTVLQLDGEVKMPTAPHLSCADDSEAELRELLDRYREASVRRTIVLRGDLPSDMGMASGELRCANELVGFIRTETGDHFHIEATVYPGVHPQACSSENDLVNFVRRMKTDASSAVAQYFLSANAYFYFAERVAKLGTGIPMIPGIILITNYSKLTRLSDACGTELSRWIRKQLEVYGDDSHSIQVFGK